MKTKNSGAAAHAKRKTKAAAPVYVFIDTNIFLDFYRANNEATLRLLERLKPHRDFIISTYQVEMEFLKDRQKVLLESLGGIDKLGPPSFPAILTDDVTTKSLKELNAAAAKKARLLKKKVLKVMKDPKHDRVYAVLQELFQAQAGHVLKRDMPIRGQIKDLAQKRFVLGYPPRKKDDTSYGDALNWEWVVECGKQLAGKIIIVSRDADYGVTYADESFLNDQLRQEYRDRVGPKRPISLVAKLSDALKELKVKVPKDELTAEKEAISGGGGVMPEANSLAVSAPGESAPDASKASA